MAITTMSKVTWWNELRVERNIRYKDLVELFGKTIGHYGEIFSGKKMPKIDEIRKLCDFFDVDYDEGLRQFAIANQNWKSDKHAKRTVTTGIHEGFEKHANCGANEIAKRTTEKAGVYELVYGKVSYDVFVRFCAEVSSNGNPMEQIYGHVDYKDFIEIGKWLGYVLAIENENNDGV